MRHRMKYRKLNRTTEHRLAMLRNMTQSLIEHGRIRTTLPKAKTVRTFAERLVTLAIDGSLSARQRAAALLTDRSIVPKDYREEYDQLSDAKRAKVLRSRSGRRYRESVTRPGVKFTAESVVHRLFNVIGPQMRQRNEKRGAAGGYTRVIKLADRRLGDNTPIAIIEFVGTDDKPRPKNKAKTNRRRKSQIRYAAYAGKPAPQRRRSRKSKTDQGTDTAGAAESATATAAPDEGAGSDERAAE